MSKQKTIQETIIKRGISTLFTVVLSVALLGSFLSFATSETDYIATTPPATIVRELTNKRDTYSKHFLLSDGSYRAITYATPIHFSKSTPNGKVMQEINTTLVKNNSNKHVRVTKFSQSATQIAKNSKYKKQYPSNVVRRCHGN